MNHTSLLQSRSAQHLREASGRASTAKKTVKDQPLQTSTYRRAHVVVPVRGHLGRGARMGVHKEVPHKPPTLISDGGLPRAAVVGVLGGGQLGQMLAQEAIKMGITIRVLDPTEDCPASRAAKQTVGSFRDACQHKGICARAGHPDS
eukprot:jgi/Botrbrau1/10665/Bobra.53_2s0021.1